MNLYVERAGAHLDEVVAIRHDIHANPELGFEEIRTSALVAEKLRGWGLEVTTGVGTLGVVGTIRGRDPGHRSVGLRADMDALAITETNALPYASTRAGTMHACGHDGHTAMLLGAARILAEHPDFSGTVHLIFQPAEEGRGGARAMLDDHLFSRFPCDKVFGLHSYPTMPIGRFGTRTGDFMAASGRWQVVFAGAGGHGGMSPHLVPDLTVVQANFVLGLQAIVARNVAATETALISVGHIRAGDPNALAVMPSELHIGGTMRAFKPDVQAVLERRIAELAEAHAALAGASVRVKAWWGTAPLVNDAEAARAAVRAASRVTEASAVDTRMGRLTIAEDFAFLAQQRPGAFAFIGNGVRTGEGGGNLHTPNYDFNDEALPFGIAYWLSVVDGELGPVEGI